LEGKPGQIFFSNQLQAIREAAKINLSRFSSQSKVERQADDGITALGCTSASVNAFNNRATFSGVKPRSSDALLQCAGN